MAKNPLGQIVIISGATCTNKSKLALEFAIKNNGSVVNGDALQVYKDLKNDSNYSIV